MSERRPHWDDDLIDAVGAAIDDYITMGVLNPQFVYAVIAAVEDWQDKQVIGCRYACVGSFKERDAAIQRVRELCDLTERTVLDAMPALEGKVVVYTSLVRRTLDGGDA